MKNYFLIELELGHSFGENYESSTALMNQMLADGKIQTYGINVDMSRMWISMLAESDYQVWEMVCNLPIAAVSEPLITSLHTYNQSIDLQFPAISMN
ncbi:MAG: hypothetical protein HKN87_16650 [Saprospiraceae bacterium]|nr:hypothetical protein [Saprospiraceae bacterium]